MCCRRLLPIKNISNNLLFDLGSISIREFIAALRDAKNHKVPDSNENPIEFFKYLNDENKETLMLVLNSWWFLARIPSIFLNI